VSEEEHARECVDAAMQAFARIDVLANIAGVLLELAPIGDYDVQQFDCTVRTNGRSAFLMTKHARPHLQRRRRNIVFARSEAGFSGTPKFSPYGGTKGFIHAFCQGWRGGGQARRARRLHLPRRHLDGPDSPGRGGDGPQDRRNHGHGGRETWLEAT
jgi:NAD(P)-dependent dehydrogenase (short-subunit alcohol dehydrogenase family)